MNIAKPTQILSLFLVLSVLVGSVAFITPARASTEHPPWGSFVNAGQVPPGSVLVLNVEYKVTSDEDSGNVGYWALDNYNKHVQVWMEPDGQTFYIVAHYAGKWQTFASALSPGFGQTQTKDASGTFEGGYVATFTATGLVSVPANPTFGKIGTFDYGGTSADILLGTYGNGQTGPSTPFDFTSAYFTGASSFSYVNWGWTYHYRSQTWNNYSSATTGDIVV